MVESKELKVNNEFKYSKEDILQACNVSERTFRSFLAVQPVAQRDFTSIGSSHKQFYNENVLKQFQMWLIKNQLNQGIQVEQVKANVENNVKLGLSFQEIVASGNIKAMKELTTFAMNACAEVARNKQLEAEKKLLLEQKEKAEAETERIIQCNKNFHNNLYTATQIANKLGITPNKVGKIANENGLKNDPIYGKLGKIQLNNSRWVDIFYYNDDALTIIESIIG